jgi:hypothetical protein
MFFSQMKMKVRWCKMKRFRKRIPDSRQIFLSFFFFSFHFAFPSKIFYIFGNSLFRWCSRTSWLLFLNERKLSWNRT